ncbi:S8 family serine peptidase [Arthrobacter sp. H35-D1]|uniref:S8 family serine peptidase n=1 Tax=Arthrobacter sp. H35-D1 TaxID=3046202 RepID=UPI0024BA9895|nr:S8 family serine peptidase [Arthrobacter sp. H35-D1]
MALDTRSVLTQERALRGLGELPLTGTGVVVGVVDWGLDLTHPAFRHGDGSTRVAALWNQQPGPVPGHRNRYGYGRIHTAAEIDRALKTSDPEAALGYHASASDLGSGSHGTATTSIAAGMDWPGGLPGMAPDAVIVFVQLSTWGPTGPQRLGDCVALAEALDFIRSVAAGRSFVINLSLGGCGGPHDGTSLLERAMDNLVRERQGQLIVQSAGNYFTSKKHAQGRIGPGEKVHLPLVVPSGPPVPHEIEVWYGGVDRLGVALNRCGSAGVARLEGEGLATLTVGGTVVAQVVQRHNDPGDGRNHILVRLAPSSEGSRWDLVLDGMDVRDGRFDSWIERDPGPAHVQAHFTTERATRETTTGTICNGWQPIVVGAYDHHDRDGAVSAFSSCGPTIDGREKPDCLAPGTRTVVARSTPASGSAGMLTVMSGTSMATPHVTGLIACLLQAGPLDGEQVRAVLEKTSRPYAGTDPGRAGFGYLDPMAAVNLVLSKKEIIMKREEPFEENILDTGAPESGMFPSDVLTALGTTARELAAAFITSSGTQARESLAARLELITGPHERLDPELRAGDLLIRSVVGEGHARVSVLVDGRVLRRDRAERAGWDVEGTHPGYFALVVEEGSRPHTRVDQWARRLTGLEGLMPANQCILRRVLLPGRSGQFEDLASSAVKGRAFQEDVAYGNVPVTLLSTLFAGDAQLAAVAAGQIRLGARGTAPYPVPAQSIGAGVAKVQEALGRLGYSPGASGADGRFGSDTGAAVSRYKRDRGIHPADPVVGPQTLRRLDSELAEGGVPLSPPGPVVIPVIAPPVSPRPADMGDRVTRWVRALGPQVRPGNRATALIDGAETYASYLDAIRTARGAGHFIYLLGWYLDLDVPLNRADGPAYCGGTRNPTIAASTMRTLLMAASQSGVQVRVMLWDQPGTQNSAEVNFVNRLTQGAAILDNNELSHTFGSQHQKVLLVSGSQGLIGFCGGLDINNDRLCPIFTPIVLPAVPGGTTAAITALAGGQNGFMSPRRESVLEGKEIAVAASGTFPESSGSSGGGGGGAPQHDVHVRLIGPAADDLLETFITRWYANSDHVSHDRVKGPLLGLCQPASPPSGRAFVRIGETFNAHVALPVRPVRSCASPPPVISARYVRPRTVQEIYLTAIAGARHYIYWEDQYMVSMCAAEALRQALPRVEFIILLMADSPISDLPHKWAWRKRFIEHIHRDPQGYKLHVFTLHSPFTGTFGAHTYVHAKTMMVDDEISLIGSANCNRRGWESDAEVVAATVGDLDADGRPFAARVRARLWSEHLGVPATLLDDPLATAHLWWDSPLASGAMAPMGGGLQVSLAMRRVLPYDANGDTDSLRDRMTPDDWVDPPSPLPGSPCGPGGTLAVRVTPVQEVVAGMVPQAVVFSVG